MTKDNSDSPELGKIDVPDVGKMMKAYQKNVKTALDDLSEAMEKFGEAVSDPTIQERVSSIESDMSNVMTDEELDDIQNDLDGIRKADSEKDKSNYQGFADVADDVERSERFRRMMGVLEEGTVHDVALRNESASDSTYVELRVMPDDE